MTAQELAHVDEAGEGETEVHLHLILNDDFQSFQVELTWEDLKGSCMVLLRPRSSFRDTATNDNFLRFQHRSCDEEESESVVEIGDETESSDDSSDDEETVIEEAAVGDEEIKEVAETKNNDGTSSREGIDWEALTLEQQQRQPRRVRGSLGILRKPQLELGRVFQSISLDSFTLLSSGTTSRQRAIGDKCQLESL